MPVNLKKDDMGDVVKDFYKSDAPQFKGKSKKKRREMAIAAKLSAEQLTFESWKEKAKNVMKRVFKKKEDKKPEKAMDAGARARRKLKDKEHNQYVNFLHADD